MGEKVVIEQKAVVVRLLEALFPGVKIYLFGSRARGAFSVRSDIDLALDAGRKLSILEIEKAKNVLEALNVPQGFDVVDLHSVAENFKKEITEEMVEWTI